MSLFCRRPPLSLLAALLATVLPIAAIGGQNPEATGQMTRKDRLAVLYSNQVIFDRKGEPLVSIRVTEGQETVRFSSKKPLTLLPSADDGARIRAPASARFVVTVEESKLGTVRTGSSPSVCRPVSCLEPRSFASGGRTPVTRSKSSRAARSSASPGARSTRAA